MVALDQCCEDKKVLIFDTNISDRNSVRLTLDDSELPLTDEAGSLSLMLHSELIFKTQYIN